MNAKQLLLLICLSFLMTSILFKPSALAVTAYPHPIEFTQPDGSKITILLKGDEKVRWALTTDGYTLMFNDDGYYVYATRNVSGEMIPSSVIANEISRRTAAEISFLAQTTKGLFYSTSQVSALKQIWEIYENETKATMAFPTTGSRKLVCILMNYTDRTFVRTRLDFENLFNQIGYTYDGATGSVKDYFLENSYNQFTITTTVVGPYTASNTMATYGANDVSGNDVNPRALITEAVNLANPDVNYADFDNDNNGTVDGVYVIYAGYDESAGGPANAIWAHKWSITTVTLDGKQISTYSCSSELRGTSGTSISRIGVICHEFGHTLGAPDFYDTDYATGGQFVGTGSWDLQADGSWNGATGGGETPAHSNPYTKIYVYNWATANLLIGGQDVTLYNAAQNKTSFYRINTTTTNEYYLLENRQLVGFDVETPGHGMIIYHVHASIASPINDGHPQEMYPVCATATVQQPTATPSTYGSINSGGCPWPGTGARTSFTDNTTPWARNWAGALQDNPITNITEITANKTITFRYDGGPTCSLPTLQASNFAVTGTTTNSLSISWTRGNGNTCLVVARATGPVNSDPVLGTNYNANAVFGSGNQIGTGNYVVYKGTANILTVTGLASGTDYHFAIYEFNSADNCYKIPGLSGSGTTDYVPVPPVSNFTSNITTVLRGNSVEFTETCTSNPVSWLWTFEGGFPSTSTDRTPQVTYVTPGVYDVTLRATNQFGYDDEVKTNYITVTNFTPPGTNPVTIGTGTAISGYPLGMAVRWGQSQSLYLASEVGGSGYIDQLSWYAQTARGNRAITIRMAHTTATTVTAATWATAVGGSTLVYQGTISNLANAWKDIVLTTPFFYNGTSNLLVMVSVDVNTQGQSSDCRYTTTTGFNRHQGWTGTVAAPSTGNGTVSTSRPNIRLRFQTYTAPVANFAGLVPVFSEDFEGATFPPTGWLINNVDGSGTTWESSNAYNHTFGGSQSASHPYEATTPNEDGYLITPQILNVPAGATLTIWSYSDYPTYYVDHAVLISTTGTAIANFTEVWSPTAVTAAWSSQQINLSAYAGQNIYIAFRYSGNDADDWYLDDVAVSVDNYTQITVYEGDPVTIYDKSTGSPTVWDWTLNGATPGSVSTQNADMTYNVAGLYPVTLRVGNFGGENSKTVNNFVNVLGRAPISDFYGTGHFKNTTLRPFIPVGGTVDYEDWSTRVPTSWSWTFDGGSPGSATTQNPSGIVYSSPGSYNTTLYTANAHGNNTGVGTAYVKVGGRDTITNLLPSDDVTIYGFTNGLIPGHSADATNKFFHWAEFFNSDYSGTVYSVSFYAYRALGTGKTVTFYVWDGSTGSPGTVLASKTVNITSFTQGQYSTLVFDSPINITGDFFVGYLLNYDATHDYATHQFCTAISEFRADGLNNTAWTSYGATTPGTWYPIVDLFGESASMWLDVEFEYTSLLPVANFSASATTVCQGSTVTFTDMSTGSPTSWAWTFPGGTPATSTAQNPVITYSTPGTYNVTLIATNGNGSDTELKTGLITVSPTVVPSVAIAITAGTNPLCAGSSVSFTATPTNGGTTPAYQWQVNGTNAGTNSPTFTTTALTNGQIVTCILTSNATCASPATATSAGITMTVNPVVVPAIAIAITAGTNPTCAGSSVTFTATPTNGGTTPAYQWKVNGVNVGTGLPTYTTTTLTNGQIVTCVLTSNATCATPTTATSAGITMTVNPVVVPSIAIALTAGTNPTCAGSSVTFTATPTNGGTTPVYQWQVNGANVGGNSPTYTTTALTNGQIVTCILTSNASCASPTTATSAGITMTVNPVVVPAVAIAITVGSNPTCAGSSVTFTATPTNGGTTPAYQWKVNGTNVGTGLPTYTTTTLTNGQIVTCVLTSNATCATPTTATSAGITMTVTPVVVPAVAIAITAGTNPTCAGSSVTFTATPTNGGTTPAYQWKVNGTNVGGNSPTYTTTTLTNGQIVTCVLTSNATCATPTTATSTGITMTINPVVVPAVAIAITAGTNPTCAGSSVTFTATPTNGGTTPAYQWKVNGTNVGTGLPTYTTTTLTNGQIVTCVLTSNATCATPTTATSAGITMTVTPVVVPSVAIAITAGTNPTCAGSSVTFTATPTNGGTTPAYQWKVNGTNVGGNSPTYTTTTLTNGQIVTCVLTSNATCATPTTATSTGITMTINPVVVPSVAIAVTAGTNPTCAGSTVTFTATPTNGGTTPVYQWQVNGTNVGAGLPTYTTTTLTNGQIVTCILTSNAPCATPTTATSAGITMTVTPVVVPAVAIAITAGTNPTCAGSSVTFTATPTNGGTTPAYQWKVNGTNVGGNSPTYTTTTLTNGQIVTCVLTSNASCATPTTATSAGITMTINPVLVPSVAIAITAGSNPTCAGSSVTFTATPTNGGATPSYQWQVNGVNAGGNSPTYTTATLTNGQIVTCILTSNATCATPTTATSTGITMTVNPVVVPSVAIAITAGSNPTCTGSSVTFTATPTNGGTTPSYQWKVNGTNVGGNTPTYTTTTLTNGQIVTCVLTSNATCASPTTATSTGITMTVNATLTPAVSIAVTAGSNPTCAGASITFTATPTNGGTTPSYQWKVNGINAGVNSPTFTTTTLVNGDAVTCVMTSNSPCASPATATSNSINIVVNATLVPAVSIAITSGSNPSCAGSSVTFTATPTNGGATPSYQWQVNGANAGINSPTFTSTTLTNGQIVTCILTSSSACASPTTATSAGITMTINPVLVPSVATAITAGTNPTCAGSSVTYTATPTNGGTTPSYQWQVNGVNAGGNSPTYTTTTLTNGQIVTCILTSNATCATPATATSAGITMTVNPVVVPAVAIAITAGTNPTCAGSSVTFTATPTNGGTTPAYQWKVNGTNVGGNSPLYTTTTLTNGQIVTCVLTSNATCATPTTATSTGITMTINPVVVPSVAIAITSGSNPTCAGSSVTFTATPTNGGTTPSYQWQVNGANVGGNAPTYTTTTLTNGQIVTCILTSNATCATPTTATSTGITMTINSILVPSVAVAVTAGSNPTCAGSAVTFTATPTNGGTTPSYQWQVNGVNAGTNLPTFTTTTLTNGQIVTCIMTSGSACASPTTATSTGITMTVNPVVVPSVAIAITAGSNPTCTGTSVTFTATPTNGGTTPSYQWQVNGVNAGTNSPTFTTTTLTNGQIVTCILTSNATCASPATATSAGVTMTVNPVVVPSVAVAITAGSNPTCSGTSVTYTATPTNGGTTPSYLWYVNGTSTGITTTTYTTSALVDNDEVTCVLTSNEVCVSPATATSIPIVMDITPAAVPSVSVAITSGVNPTCSSDNVTFTASPVNGGSLPGYQWFVNGVSVGTNSDSYTANNLTNGQIVTCILTSNATCATPTTATSTGITMTVNPLPVVVVSNDGPYCIGDDINLSATGGSSYLWTGPSSFTSSVQNPVLTGSTSAMAGDYYVTVTDLGCSSSGSTTVVVNDIPVVSAGSDVAVCAGSSVTLAGSGADSYVWNNGVSDGIAFIQPAGVVIYTVTGTTNGCSATDDVEVTVNSIPVVSAGVNQTVCDGSLITLSGSGADTYTWDNGVSDGVAFSQAIGSVTYTVTGELNGCFANDIVDVTVVEIPVADVTTVNASCGMADGTATVSATGGSGIYTYQWDAAAGSAVIPAITGLALGSYYVTVNDGNCSVVASGTVQENGAPVVVVTPLDTAICQDQSVTLTASGADIYSWTPATYLDNSINAVVVCTPGDTITYTVTGTSGGCSAQTQVTVFYKPLPLAGFTYTTDMLTIYITDASQYATTWSYDMGDANVITDQSPTYTYLASGDYTITQTVSNECGTNVYIQDITVIDISVPYVSDGVSFNLYPNPGNGVCNLVFNAPSVDDYTVRLINHAGQIVYTKKFTKTHSFSIEELDFSEQAMGAYRLQIIYNDKALQTPLIINKY